MSSRRKNTTRRKNNNTARRKKNTSSRQSQPRQSQQTRRKGWLPPSRPIETDQGLRIKSQRGKFVQNWWAKRWLAVLKKLMDPGRLSRGRSYARYGQVLQLDESNKGMTAIVQGSQPTPYTCKISLTPLTPKKWENIISLLSQKASFSAQLLIGEMPEEIEEIFEQANANLFPQHRRELRTRCSCPDQVVPCKHIAAVYYLMGERLDEDPFLLFRLRGLKQDQLFSSLQHHGSPLPRKQKNAAAAAAPATAEINDTVALFALSEAPDVSPSIHRDVEQFWSPKQLHELSFSTQPPEMPLSSLLRLGPPAFLPELIELFDTPYQAASLRAQGLPWPPPPETPSSEIELPAPEEPIPPSTPTSHTRTQTKKRKPTTKTVVKKEEESSPSKGSPKVIRRRKKTDGTDRRR